MNVLETILHFITQLARIIFPRKRKPAAGDCPCPHPLPAPVELPLAPDAGDGSGPDLHRSDTLALVRPLPSDKHPEADWLGISGYCLMVAGGAGYLLKYLL